MDTGVPVGQAALRTTVRSSLLTSQGSAPPRGVAKELIECLRHAQTDPQSRCRTAAPVGPGPPTHPPVDSRSVAVLLSSRTNVDETLDEFFI